MTDNTISADDVYDMDKRSKNAERYDGSKHVDECFACGRGLTQSALNNGWWCHLLNTGKIVSADVLDHPDSQGWFPLGSEWAKKVPLAFRARNMGVI